MLNKNKIYIAPSILSADFSRLGDETRSVKEAGGDIIHIDVMDGRFVPNITIGPPVVRSIRNIVDLPFDVHLMVEEPERYIEDFTLAGADIITVHLEASKHLNRIFQKIREVSVKHPPTTTGRRFDNILIGVSLNPHTPISLIEEIIPDIDLLLIMTVNPGFGGQRFIESTISKIKKANKMLKDSRTIIEVDGGVTDKNARLLIKNGARILVSGNYIFNSNDKSKAIRGLRG